MRTSSSTRHAFRVPVGRVVDPDHLNILQQRLAPLSHGGEALDILFLSPILQPSIFK